MAISVVAVSSDSSKESKPTTPLSLDYTPASPDYSPVHDIEFNPSEDPPSDHIPPLPAILPFLSSTDDTTDSDTPDTPPSPTHALRQPIPHGRPYRYHPNGPLKILLQIHHQRHHQIFHLDASSDSSSRQSLSDHFSLDLLSNSVGPSHKRRRSPMTFIPALSLVFGALSPVRADLIPSPKRVRDSGYLADIKDIDPKIQAEIDECIAYADALRDRGIDAIVVVEAIDREESETGTRGLDKVRVYMVTHHAMLEDTTEPPQEERAVECMYETLGSLVQRFHDHTLAIPVHCVQVIKGVQREQGRRIVVVKLAVAALTERISELERDNRRLKGTASVEEQIVDRLQRGMSHMKRELRQIRHRFSSYIQIPINPPDQEKTTFTCPYGTFAYRRIPFSLCNALGTFQRCMMAIFHDMIEKTMEDFMDDFSVFRDSFSSCLSHLDTMLQRCEDTNLVLNWEKCHFMVKEGIILSHKISKNGLEVDHSKIDVIAKLPYLTTVKGVRSFLRHAGFYRRFIQDFSMIARHMTQLLEKETPFVFSKYCIDDFETLKKKLTKASILVVLDWNIPFELMCDASDFTIGMVLGQRKTKHFQPTHYASKAMTESQIHYTMMEKQMLA
uniref:Reverse transcriptase domain-containing protein n=1 Tax=Tanacetum cinerariifolium TaxID=118510 RepID=A0A6L2LBJ6_TANCI|nr:reverse transcriptase domain-containing protein [Tanacetum cinerariifolium]